MNDKRRIHISKYLALHLRHQPDAIGLTLEPGGWVAVEELLRCASNNRFPIKRVELDEVVAQCQKQRYAFDETGLKIRANQGHSVEVDLQLEPVTPPEVLYHGTGAQNRDAILATGIKKISRQHVHLSPDVATARTVGTRHGKPLIFVVAARSMNDNGHEFFQAKNGVWLTDHVPPEFLSPASG